MKQIVTERTRDAKISEHMFDAKITECTFDAKFQNFVDQLAHTIFKLVGGENFKYNFIQLFCCHSKAEIKIKRAQ